MSEQATYTKPLPLITRQSKPFWDACKRHELLVQSCPSCGHKHLPPADLCPMCSTEMEWVKVSGRGTIHTFTIFHQLYNPAFKDDLPYNVCIVELEEGPFVLSALINVANSDIKVGMPVKVVFQDVTPEETIHKFVLA